MAIAYPGYVTAIRRCVTIVGAVKTGEGRERFTTIIN